MFGFKPGIKITIEDLYIEHDEVLLELFPPREGVDVFLPETIGFLELVY